MQIFSDMHFVKHFYREFIKSGTSLVHMYLELCFKEEILRSLGEPNEQNSALIIEQVGAFAGMMTWSKS